MIILTVINRFKSRRSNRQRKLASVHAMPFINSKKSKRSLQNSTNVSPKSKNPSSSPLSIHNGKQDHDSTKKSRLGSTDNETLTYHNFQGAQWDTWSTLPSDVIFQIGKWLPVKQALSMRLLNKHWCLAGRSFVTSMRLNVEKEFKLPSQLTSVLQKFSGDTYHHLKKLSIRSQLRKGYEGLNQLSRLTSLNISWCSADTHQFASIESLTNLTSLSLSWTHLKDEGMHYLSQLTELCTLNLECCHITEASIPLLANLTNLSNLSLCGLQAYSEDCLQPLGSLRKMVCLDLSGMYLSNQAISPLLNLTNLNELNLASNLITSQALENISVLKQLRKLNLSRTKVANDGLVYLTALDKLDSLTLSGSDVADRGLHHLISLRFLSFLDLSDNYLVCSNNLQYLMPLARLEFLHHMNLQRTQANETGVEMFLNAVRPRKLVIDY